jgi:hypothetical protein
MPIVFQRRHFTGYHLVLQYFERFIFFGSIADEREDVQKKTFGKWINSQLTKVSY